MKRPAGLNEPFVTAISNVRNALDKRVERKIFGEDPPPQRVKTALRLVRQGDLAKLQLLHLIDGDDGEDNALTVLIRPNGLYLLLLAFKRLLRVLMYTHPLNYGPALRNSSMSLSYRQRQRSRPKCQWRRLQSSCAPRFARSQIQ